MHEGDSALSALERHNVLRDKRLVRGPSTGCTVLGLPDERRVASACDVLSIGPLV